MDKQDTLQELIIYQQSKSQAETMAQKTEGERMERRRKRERKGGKEIWKENARDILLFIIAYSFL